MLHVRCTLNKLQFTAFQQALPQTCIRIGDCGSWIRYPDEFDLVIPLPPDDEELFYTFAAQHNIIYVPVKL